MNAAPASESRCSECGAQLPAQADTCWLCGASAYPLAELVDPGECPFAERTARQFSLATMMLAIALLAVLIGTFRLAPGAGVVLAILVAPAYLRTCIVALRRKAGGQPMSAGAKLGVFGSTLGIAVAIAVCLVGLVGVAAVAAFFVICLANAT